MPTSRIGLAGGVLTNAAGQTIFYAIGGVSPALDNTYNVVEAYNPATDTWSTKAPLPADRVYPNGTGAINGKLYLSGGYDGANTASNVGFTIGTLFVYDPTANTWTPKASLPITSAAGITGVVNGKLYVLTGIKNECEECPVYYTHKLYRYDPATNAWTRLTSCPNRHGAGAGGVIDGKFYVAGGLTGSTSSLRLDAYDPATDTWSPRANLPTGTWGRAGAVLGKKLYLISSDDGRMEAYDPATNTWSAKAPGQAAAAAAGKIKSASGQLQIVTVAAGGAEEPGHTFVYTP